MTCKKCGKEILTLADYHTRTMCRECYNQYERVKHREYYHRYKPKCDFHCYQCKFPDCVLPTERAARSPVFFEHGKNS